MSNPADTSLQPKNLAAGLPLIQDVLRPFLRPLADRTGAADSMLFALLFLLEVDILSSGIAFRERDFSYFSVEDWGNVGTSGKYTVKCVHFEGEIPFLYSVVPNSGLKVISTQSPTFPSFLGLVDFVAERTGSGLAVLLDAPPTSQSATDLRTGRRVRYQVSKLPKQKAGPNGEYYYWFQRTESGASGSYATVMEG